MHRTMRPDTTFRLLALFTLFAAVVPVVVAQPLEVDWVQLIGSEGYCMVRDVYVLDDGVVAAATNGDELDTMSADLWVDKYDFDGNLVWRTIVDHWHPEARLLGYGVDQAPNGEIVVIAPAIVGPQHADPVLVRLEPDGTLIDTVSLDWGYHERGLDIEATPEGDLVICGWAFHQSDSDPGQDAWMAKLTPTGEVLWFTWLGSPTEQDQAWSIEVLSDGNYACAGRTWWTGGAGGRDAVIWKLDPDGNLLWTATYGGPDKDHIYEFQETPDGGFIGAGKTESFDVGDEDHGDAWLLRFDSEGNLLWRLLWGDELLEFGRSVDLTSDGGFIMAGVTLPPGEGMGNQYLVAKASADGEWEWAHHDGGWSMEDLWAVREIAPGDYVVGGITKSSNQTPRTGMVLRLQEPWAGVDPTHPVETIDSNVPTVQTGPNPLNGTGTVRFTLRQPGDVNLSLHDVLGRQVAVVHRGSLQAGEYSFPLLTESLASGNYFLRMARGGEVLAVERVTVMK